MNVFANRHANTNIKTWGEFAWGCLGTCWCARRLALGLRWEAQWPGFSWMCSYFSVCVDWLARAMLVSCISFKIDKSMILDFRKQWFATLKQACGRIGCLFQLPSWFVLVCVYAGSHIWLCTRTLVCISEHWPPCVWVCAPASVYCWTAKAILTIKRRATSWASTYPAFPSLFNVSLLCSIFTVTSCLL